MTGDQIVVVFDVAQDVGREAAALSIVRGLNDWQDTPIGAACESWWIADGDLKHVDRNDNRAMRLVDDEDGGWYDDRDNLLLLLRWMGDMSSTGFRAVIAEPWTYEREFRTAAAARDHEQANPDHEVLQDGPSDTSAYCDFECCDWRIEDGAVNELVVQGMTARMLDGAVVSQGGREWILHEDEDDEGRRFGWSECGACGETVLGGDDARSDHECRPPCPECDEPRAEALGSYDGTRVWSCCGEEVRCPCGSVTSTNHRSVCTAWIEP